MENLNPSESPKKRMSLGIFPTMAQPGKLILIFSFIIIVFMFGAVAFLYVARTSSEDSFSYKLVSSLGIKMTEDEESDNDNNESEISNVVNEIEEENNIAELSEEFDDVDLDQMEFTETGNLMVYIDGKELVLLKKSGEEEVLDTIDSAFESLAYEQEIYYSYPKISPDKDRILYSSNNDLMVYDLSEAKKILAYDGHISDEDYSNLNRYTWKSNSEIIFVSEEIDSVEEEDGYYTIYTVNVLNLDTEEINKWGEFKTLAGWGGSMIDPALSYYNYFHDVSADIDNAIYYDFDNESVYVETYLEAPVWVEIKENVLYSIVDEDLVAKSRGLEDFEITRTVYDEYGNSLDFYNVEIDYSNQEVLDENLFAIVNLRESTDYLYFTRIHNSYELANAFSEDEDLTYVDTDDYSPEYGITRVSLEDGTVEDVVKGLGFDLF